MKTMLKKLSAFSIGPIVAAFIGFINVPVITHVISTDEYGRSSMFVVAQSMISLILYLGLDQAFVREFNAYRREKSKLIKNAMILPGALSLLAALFILLFAPWISELLFGSRAEILPTAGLAVMLPFMVVYNFSLLNIRMQERGLLYSFFMIALKAATLLITLLLFFGLEKSFRSVVYAIAIAEILNGIAAGIFLVREIRASDTPAPVDPGLIGRMLRFGVPLIPAALLVWAMSSMDKIMLRAMMSYSELGLYEAAFKIVNALGIVQTWFTLVWTPVAYRWHEEKRPTEKYSCVMKLVAVMMTGLCLLILLMKDLVAWVLGHNFTASIFIFPFLLLHPIMYTMSETTALGINFSRRTSFNILVSVVSGGANILLNYLFIPLWGGRGAAIATGLSYLVFFWMRSLISRGLWYRFPLREAVFYTIIILGNCLAHTFLTSGPAAYVISAFSLAAVLVLNVPRLKEYKAILTADDAVKEEAAT